MVVVVDGLVGVDVGYFVAEGVPGAWVKDLVTYLAMVAVAAVVYLLGGIASLLPHPSRTDLDDGAVSGETLELLRSKDGGAFVSYSLLGDSYLDLDTGKRDQWKGNILAFMIAGTSDVGDMALVEVVGSSLVCSWVFLTLFVVAKLKLRW
jgi:hypothetical protein